jgi:L-alanine-DL-glutamate epimerase-like enolase superfamily enzyme
MALLMRNLAPLLIGRDPDRVEEIWRTLFFHTHATAVGAITSLALAAIDTALWDMRCRRSGRPLHVEAGGAQESVALYTTEGGWLHIETAELVADALRAKAAGFGGSKIKVGRPPKEDAARLAAVREAVGDDFEIMVDGNQGAAVDEAIRRARLYEPFDLAWYEEPLPAEDLGGHIRLSAATTLPVAVGESIYSVSHFREYLQRDACNVVQVDVARIGGITPWLKVAHLAEAFNVPVCPHFLMELHVSLSAAVPNGRWVEYIPQLDSLTTTGMRIENGRAVPSSEPGLGIAWDWQAIDRLRVDGATHVVR